MLLTLQDGEWVRNTDGEAAGFSSLGRSVTEATTTDELLSLIDPDGTLVTANDPLSLTQKTVVDDSFWVADGTDPTKRSRFNVPSLQATGTTRLLTLPGFDSTLVGADAYNNVAADAFVPGWTTAAAAAGTTVLTADSTQIQELTGTLGQIVQMPSTDVVGGRPWIIAHSGSAGTVTVNAADGSLIRTVLPGHAIIIWPKVAVPTLSTHWFCLYLINSQPAGGSAAASTIPLRTSDGNIVADAFIEGRTLVTSAAGTTVLTTNSTQIQVLTGTTTHTFTLPAADIAFRCINTSTGALTVNSSAGNLVKTVAAGTSSYVTPLKSAPTAATDWFAS